MLTGSILMMQSPTEEVGDFGETPKGGSVRILQESLVEGGRRKLAQDGLHTFHCNTLVDLGQIHLGCAAAHSCLCRVGRAASADQ